jgi:hypothetical protein
VRSRTLRAHPSPDPWQSALIRYDDKREVKTEASNAAGTP